MTQISKRSAIAFVVFMGVVSLFGDMTYEGARSILGQYLAILGASGFVVGAVAGVGELIGYGLRLLFGYLSDKTGKYWALTITGYACNLLAVPLLSLAGSWQSAAALVILERFGKAIRTPSKDAMLSYATKATGRGWGFGLHEAMDQTGAIIGPLLVSLALYQRVSYQQAFGLLLIPALCALGVLICARLAYPRPQDLEIETSELTEKRLTKKYWLYMAALCCVAAGYVDFALIAYHLKMTSNFSETWVPIFFALSMGVAGVSALIFGRLYDRFGLGVLLFSICVASFFAPLVFSHEFYLILTGMILWGVGQGSQESIMRAFVATLVQRSKRGTAYGLLHMWFGIFWFFGSALMGFLYDVSILYLVIFSLGIQLVSIPLLLLVRR